jgi:hypothetical protein
LKAARGCKPEASDFSDHPGKAAMPKPFLNGGQDFRLAACLGVNDAVRMKADGREGGGE